jgi:hypothetical protein
MLYSSTDDSDMCMTKKSRIVPCYANNNLDRVVIYRVKELYICAFVRETCYKKTSRCRLENSFILFFIAFLFLFKMVVHSSYRFSSNCKIEVSD